MTNKRIRRILLVDDDSVSSFLCTRLLQRLGFDGELDSASNGMEAMEKVRNAWSTQGASPDLILLDINMPVMDGFEFLRKLAAEPASRSNRPPVVVVSSSDDSIDLRKAKELGAVNYVVKPITDFKLREVLTEIGTLTSYPLQA